LLASGGIIFVQFALFLVLGVMLYAWRGAPVIHSGESYDFIFPEFIVSALPHGMRGLMLASILAIAMSNASGSLNSLAASSVLDFQQLRGAVTDPSAGASEIVPDGEASRRFLRHSRWMTLVWGVVLALLGTLRWGPMLEAGLTIASITFGVLLGLFLLAFFLRWATASGVLSGMFAGLAGMLYIHFRTPLLWPWYVLMGTAITFICGALASAVPFARNSKGTERNI